MKLRRAATRHRSLSVRTRCIVTPSLNGLVFDALIRMATVDGAAFESTETLAMDKCMAGSYADWVATVASPDRRKPKKQTHDTTHGILV